MQDDINNTKQDAFSEMFRQKIANHQVQVDENLWAGIEKQLQPKRKKVAAWIWFSIGSAAVLALLITFNQFYDREINTADSNHKNINKAQNLIANQQKSKEVIRQTPFIKTNLKKEISKKKNQKTNFQKQVLNHNIIVADITKYKSEADVQVQSPVCTAPSVVSIEPEKKFENKKDSTTNSSTPINVPNTLIAKDETQPIMKVKNSNKWLVAAVFGSGGSESSIGGSTFLNSSDMVYANANANEALVSADTKSTSILTPNDFSSKVHLPPVSFGVVFRKSLNKAMSLQSGLVYTYLLSTFENTGMQHYDAKLHLHYIGVPLNFISTVWNNKKLELYFSAGGMIEKGLRSNYIQNQYFSNQTYTTRADTKIDGLQWSVNTGFGVTYKLNKSFGIYFEPKISYYLENNQPMSARTVQPLIVGMNAGLQFGF
jgi:hypothetical protein